MAQIKKVATYMDLPSFIKENYKNKQEALRKFNFCAQNMGIPVMEPLVDHTIKELKEELGTEEKPILEAIDAFIKTMHRSHISLQMPTFEREAKQVYITIFKEITAETDETAAADADATTNTEKFIATEYTPGIEDAPRQSLKRNSENSDYFPHPTEEELKAEEYADLEDGDKLDRGKQKEKNKKSDPKKFKRIKYESKLKSSSGSSSADEDNFVIPAISIASSSSSSDNIYIGKNNNISPI